MKKEFTITLTLDTETAKIESLDITEGIFYKTGYILEGVDEPISINSALYYIGRDLAQYIG